MSNIIDYIKWRGDLSFHKSPFNEVDNLIFSQLIYLDFDGIVPGINEKNSISLAEAGRLCRLRHKDCKDGRASILQNNVMQILDVLPDSRRFSGCMLSKYVNDIDDRQESQFCAMKIELEDGSVYVAFSGTDNTVAGWKENFNMSYLSATPGQLKAVEYVKETVPFYKNRLRFGGHSKGGNLAVYAAMHSRKSIQKRIIKIYNNDGPGFNSHMIEPEGYNYILPKIDTILPQSSIIGMLLEHHEDINIIQSTNKGIMQHDALSWEVMGTEFVHLKKLSDESVKINNTFNRWIESMNDSDREKFVDALFDILKKADINDTDELARLNIRTATHLLKAFSELDGVSRSALLKTLKMLIAVATHMSEEQKRIN